jgi:hypothetical protein
MRRQPASAHHHPIAEDRRPAFSFISELAPCAVLLSSQGGSRSAVTHREDGFALPLKEVPDRIVKLNLLVSTDCQPKSASCIPPSGESERSLPMSNTSVKVAIALSMVLAMPAASFARGGGAFGGGSVATGHFGAGRPNAGAGRLNGAALGALDPGLNPSQNLPKAASIPPPRISVPTVPQFK